MKKTSSLINFQVTISSLIILYMLFTPMFIYAATYYRCIDRSGSEIISNSPLQDVACKPMGTFEEMTDEERVNAEKRRNEAFEKMRMWNLLNECLQRADERYRAAWERDCRLLNLYPRCEPFPIENANRLDTNYTEDRNECRQLYPQ